MLCVGMSLYSTFVFGSSNFVWHFKGGNHLLIWNLIMVKLQLEVHDIYFLTVKLKQMG